MKDAQHREGGPPCLPTVRAATAGRPRGWIIAGLFMLAAVPVLAQSNAGYDHNWFAVDSGGSTFSIGEGYWLGGTAGQPDTGVMTGDGYSLAGGFWPGGAATPEPHYMLYLPLGMGDY